MLNSVLLHFKSTQQHAPVIDMGVELAKRTAARVRGLTLIDTRRLAALSTLCESAAYAHGEGERLGREEAEHEAVRAQLSQACLAAGVDFEVRRVRGNPLEVLPLEAQFHDLVVTALPPPGQSEHESPGLCATELIDLLWQGVGPLLVVRSGSRPLARVLLVSDGTAAAAKSARHFLSQDLLPRAELRLLGIGESEARAKASLRELVDYCRGQRSQFETGWICGASRRVLPAYAQKWGAQLVVLGAERGSRVVRRLLGEAAEQLLSHTDIAIYAAA